MSKVEAEGFFPVKDQSSMSGVVVIDHHRPFSEPLSRILLVGIRGKSVEPDRMARRNLEKPSVSFTVTSLSPRILIMIGSSSGGGGVLMM